jgi:hypothetical protein
MGEHLLARVVAVTVPLAFVFCGAGMLLFLASVSS